MCKNAQLYYNCNLLAPVNNTNNQRNAIINIHYQIKSYKKKDPFKRIR